VIGRVFDNRYEVKRRLGSGGMADVYLAYDQLLGREVALKVLAPHFAGDEEFVERFRREAAAAASLNHPNIVQIYDKGEAEGTYYIAMEYLEGRSLKEIIVKHAPLGPDLVVSVSRQIVEALRYVHRRDIIHRDIKPQNIIVDDDGRVKVTDFGIARAGSVSSVTEAGSSIGTAHYLSPEQAQGLPVEAASDLYSLGIVMYEMATGTLPFDGDNAVSIAMQHVHDTPVAPRNIVPDIPESLEAVIMRALSKRPVERYLTAQSMLDDIWRVQEGKPVEPPQSLVDESTRPFRPVELAAGGDAQATRRSGQTADPSEEPPEIEPLPEEYFGGPSSKRRWWPWVAVGVLLLALALTAVGISTWGRTGELGVVPSVVGLTLEDAEARIKDAGFKLKNEGPQASATVAEGLVASQKPEEGSNMGMGGTVSVWISSGSGPVTVPNVVGMDRFEAIAQLEALGLDVLLEEEPTDETDKVNYVQSQEPAPGMVVDAGATVTIWVAVPSNMVVVPNLLGMSQAAAESALAGVGLEASVVEVDSTEPGGTVVSQDPAAGTQVQAGAKVTVEVSNAPPSNQVTVPPVGGLNYTVQQATNILSQHHLNATLEYYPTGDYPPGVVIQQNPVAGEVVEAGSYVLLTVAEALPPTTTTSTTTTLPPTTESTTTTTATSG
jgi:serine/threonine protein kinase/beta-lactam-binding protein with PASTA domain